MFNFTENYRQLWLPEFHCKKYGKIQKALQLFATDFTVISQVIGIAKLTNKYCL